MDQQQRFGWNQQQQRPAAPEWHPSTASSPGSPRSRASAVQSDLNAAAVKEFVPGRTWQPDAAPSSPRGGGIQQTDSYGAAASSPTVAGMQPHAEHEHPPAHTTQYHETTLPAGPSSAPWPSSSVPFRALHSMSVSDDQWRHYRHLSLESMRQMSPSDPRHKAVPLPYCNAYCLDDDVLSEQEQRQQQQQQRSTSSNKRSSFFGYPASTFCVTSRDDGHLYCLRRFDNVRSVSPKIAAAVSDRWTRTSSTPPGGLSVPEHPGVVPLYQCFVAQRAVFFVHQYIPGGRSLQQERLRRLGAGQAMPEPLLWSCLAQLVSAIRCIHSHQLAVRTLNLQHVLCTVDAASDSSPSSAPRGHGSHWRLRLNCLGIVDALEFEARKHVADLQRQDMVDLGRLIVSLATGSIVTALTDRATLAQCDGFISQHYSRELHHLAMTLVQGGSSGGSGQRPPPPPSILDVSRVMTQHFMDEQDAAYRALDRTERALSSEYESGRALRLLLKLGFINERPEFGPNRRWAQSGDCYVLQLFRDFVFHQADGAGNPVMDLGHVITALNKVDAGDEEKLVLASRDGKSLMVVTYADIARCLESAFQELCSGALPASALQRY